MTIYSKHNPKTIQKMFGSIAKRYDRANAILSFGLHKRWNAELVKQVANNDYPSPLLDLCCGTGDIAFSFLRSSKQQQQAYLVDFCEEMLACSREKAAQQQLQHHDISYIQADVQELPLPDQSAGCATVAYGIRNVKDPNQFIREVYRVLCPGAPFGILELTRPTNPLLRVGHQVYLKGFLPLLARFITTNHEAYQYLCNSIQSFIPAKDIQKMLDEAGFERTRCIPLTGGVASIVIGYKNGH